MLGFQQGYNFCTQSKYYSMNGKRRTIYWCINVFNNKTTLYPIEYTDHWEGSRLEFWDNWYVGLHLTCGRHELSVVFLDVFTQLYYTSTIFTKSTYIRNYCCGSRIGTDEKEQTEASTLVLSSLTFINVTFQILNKLRLQEIIQGL